MSLRLTTSNLVSIMKFAPPCFSSLLLLFVASVPCRAAQSGAQTTLTTAALLEERKASFSESIPLFIAGKIGVAEQTLLSVNREKPGTAAAQIADGQRLYSMAVYLRANGYQAAAGTAATRALNAFDQAVSLARAKKDSLAESKAQQQAGVVCEDFLGDVKAARVYFDEATRLNPADQNAARRAEHAKRADEQLTRANGK